MKKKLLIGALVLALTAAAVCPAAYALASAEGEAGAAEAVIAAAVLRQGSTGGEVKEVQRRLKKWGYYSGSVDGIFGSGTKKAVISFQKKNGLTADGVVGKATYKALGMTDSYNALVNGGSSGGGEFVRSLSSRQDHLRRRPRRTLHGAGGDRRGHFKPREKFVLPPTRWRASSISRGAFTAVSDGQINLEPNQDGIQRRAGRFERLGPFLREPLLL